MAEAVTAGLQKGETLTAAMKPYQSTFPLFHRLVQSAEEGEMIEDGLLRSAEILEDLAGRRQHMFLTILYPCVVFTLVYAGAVFLLCFSGGIFKGLFESMHVTLPVVTRLFLMLSGFLSSAAGVIVALLPLALLWCVVLGKTPMAGWLYKVPIYGGWLKQQESIMFLSTLGQLVEQGTPLLEACRVASTACAPLVEAKLAVSEKLESGDSLSRALQEGGVVPELATWALAQREDSGNLRLREIARLLQRDLDRSTHTGALFFEPILFFLILMGMGFFLVAVFLPIWNLVGNLS